MTNADTPTRRQVDLSQWRDRDAYDRELEYGSPDPEDVSVTVRVMTVMLASEY